jgi:hypothetical protein
MNGDGKYSETKFISASSSKAVTAQREEDAITTEAEMFLMPRGREISQG